MALFCVPEDVGGDCKAHVEIGLDNFKAWENPTCDFAGNMKFKVAQSDPAAAGGIDDDEDEDVWAEEPVVYVGDTGITETSTKSSHTTPASFGSTSPLAPRAILTCRIRRMALAAAAVLLLTRFILPCVSSLRPGAT